MMRSVLGWGADGGFGTARKLPFARKAIANNLQIGAKTGSGPSDLWMISVSPRLVVVVWVGYENGHSKFEHSGDAFAAQTAAMVWDDFLTAVLKSRPDFLIGKF
jgi:membrane peptidoglycan carboxypeptidase